MLKLLKSLGQVGRRVDALEGLVSRLSADTKAIQTAVPPAYDDRAVLQALDQLEERMNVLREAVAEGIERVDRSERRIAQVVRRAKERYEEDPGVEAEYRQLQGELLPGDGAGGDRGGLQHVSEAVEGRRLDTRSVPGIVTDEMIRRITGG